MPTHTFEEIEQIRQSEVQSLLQAKARLEESQARLRPKESLSATVSPFSAVSRDDAPSAIANAGGIGALPFESVPSTDSMLHRVQTPDDTPGAWSATLLIILCCVLVVAIARFRFRRHTKNGRALQKN